MQIVVIAGGDKQKTFQDKEIPEGVLVQFFASLADAKKDADGYFYLLDKEQVNNDIALIESLEAPVFLIDAPPIENLPPNAAVIEGWPTFLFEKTLTVHFQQERKESLSKILKRLDWDFKPEVH